MGRWKGRGQRAAELPDGGNSMSKAREMRERHRAGRAGRAGVERGRGWKLARRPTHGWLVALLCEPELKETNLRNGNSLGALPKGQKLLKKGKRWRGMLIGDRQAPGRIVALT